MAEFTFRSGENEFAFTIEVGGEMWDCYYFVKDGKDGTMAITIRDEKVIVGLFQKDRLTEQQAIDALESNLALERN